MERPNTDSSGESGDRRRSAACVKACEGIPTLLLERGIILRLIAACVHVTDPRVREVLEELALQRLILSEPKNSRGGDHEVRRRDRSSPAISPTLRPKRSGMVAPASQEVEVIRPPERRG